MKHFKDSVTGEIYAFEDDVTVTLDQSTGIYSFAAIDFVNVPPVMGENDAGEVVELTPASVEETHRCTLSFPQTLLPITDDELAEIRKAQQDAINSLPNAEKFIDDSKAAFGGIAGLIPLAGLATLFFSAVQGQDWQGVQDLISAAKASAAINAAQFAALKSAAIENNIPITLA